MATCADFERSLIIKQYSARRNVREIYQNLNICLGNPNLTREVIIFVNYFSLFKIGVLYLYFRKLSNGNSVIFEFIY